MMKKIPLLMAALMVAVLALSGCGAITRKLGDEIGERIIENASGGDVDVDMDNDKVTVKDEDGNSVTVDSSEGQPWPESLPEDLPEFDGRITGSLDSQGGVLVTFEGVDNEDMINYVNEVKEAGYEKQTETTAEGNFIGIYQKDEATVTITYSEDSSMTLAYAKDN